MLDDCNMTPTDLHPEGHVQREKVLCLPYACVPGLCTSNTLVRALLLL